MLNKELMFKFSVEHIKDEVISLCSAELQKEKLFNKSFNKLAEDYYFINRQIKNIVNKQFLFEDSEEEKNISGVPYVINGVIPLYTIGYSPNRYAIRVNTAHNTHTGISIAHTRPGIDCFKNNIIIKSKLSSLSQIFHNYIITNTSDIAAAKSLELDYSVNFSNFIKNLLVDISDKNYLSVNDFLDIGTQRSSDEIIKKIKKNYDIISLTSDKNLENEIEKLKQASCSYSNQIEQFLWTPPPLFTKKFKT